MAWYLVQASYAPEQIKAITANPQDRSAPVKALVEAMGGKLHHFFFCFGDYDIVALMEGTGNVAAAAGALAVGSAGTTMAFKTTPLLTMDEAVEAMKMAGTLLGTYKAPAG